MSASRLSDTHYKMLAAESGISDEVISARGYRTITDPAELRKLGFAESQCRATGLLLPLWTTDGQNGHFIYRPDNPRVVENRRKGKLSDGTYPQKVIKYEQPKGGAVRVDCPPSCQPRLADPLVPLFITEGQKKADALVSHGACAIALTGVWNFKGKNEFGGTTFLADFDYIALDGRTAYLVFDSDVMTKQPVRKALERFTEHLKRKGAAVHHIFLPHLDDGKTGVDDWLVATGKRIDDLMALAEGPRPELKAAAPLVELLDESPDEMRRPLALIRGKAYAAAWPYVKVTRKESFDRKTGNIIRHDPPIVENERRLFIVDSQGVIFGDGGDKPLSDLPFTIHLEEMPVVSKLLSAPALKCYRQGKRSDAADLFGRITEVINRFIDFDRSLADQQTMTELVACFTISTYMLDGLSVASNLWPNGDRGSGKTQLLSVICQMAYLGQVVLAGGSFASLRDLADYGATLGFDDAETLADAHNVDQDKRTLLLAGNRRGNTVTLKEKGADGRWRNRHVSTYSFRLFSAIRLPDNVLGSRTIVVPLIRTIDRSKANADPMVFSEWPHDRQALVDDLWCLALAHLPEIPALEKQVNERAQLVGRNLEPWRPILTVALLLEGHGVEGLFDRLDALSVAYQSERPQMEVSDLTSLIIRALIKAFCDISDKGDVSDVSTEAVVLLTSTITDYCQNVGETEETDINLEYVTSRRVGRALGAMRFQKEREPGTGRRGWRIRLAEVQRSAQTYGIQMSEKLSSPPLPVNVTDASNVTDVTARQLNLLEGEL